MGIPVTHKSKIHIIKVKRVGQSKLKTLWQMQHTPMALAILLVIAVYVVAITKLSEYIVAGV